MAVVLTGAIALPERCPEVDARTARAAAERAVQWFERNQLADGRWLYRYDRDRDERIDTVHLVRHSGVTMSLYQAAAAGIDGALELADDGADWSLGNVAERGEVSAITVESDLAPIGATALLVAGLSIRELSTGEPRHAAVLERLGRLLVGQIESNGAVLESWDPATGRPVPDEHNRFYTGEVFWALTLMSARDPDGGWREHALRIGEYLANHRDQEEGIFPPMSDHWAAYGVSELAAQHLVTDWSEDYAERLAVIFGVQIRYESQRAGHGPLVLLRGPRAVPAGLGTLGEGLGSLWRMGGEASVLDDQRADIADRTRCAAGMLVDRQVDAPGARPEEYGAWFRDGITQMDDQQHALSALLLAEPILADADDPGSSDAPWTRVLQLAAVLSVAALVELPDGSTQRTRRRPTALAAVAIAVLVGGVAADPIVDLVGVSAPTVGVAAGVVLLVVALTRLVVPLRASDAVGPAAVVVALAIGAELDVVRTLVAVVLGVAVAGLVARTGRVSRPVARRAVAAAGVVAALHLVLTGVLAV